MVNEKKKTKKGGISVNRKSVEEVINEIKMSMSMEKLAEEIGVNRSTIYNLLDGEKASPDTLIKFSFYTKVCLDELIAEKADAAKVKKKIIIDCIDRINERDQEKEIQALWDLMLPYIKRSFLPKISGKGDKGINTPFELLMILKEEHGNFREELKDWIREYASREHLLYKKVIISLQEMVGNLYPDDRTKRSE